MDPFRDLEDMRRRMEKMFKEFSESDFTDFQRPEADVINKDKEISVIVELPGASKDDIEINAEPRTLEVKADVGEERKEEDEGYYYKERSSKTYRRKWRLPAEIKPDKAEASYSNGVLEITLPKAHPEEKGNRIEVK